MITTFFIIAFSLILIFRFIYFVKNKLPFPEKSRRVFNYLLPVFELLIWVGFILWMSWKIYDSKNYFALISIGVVIVLLLVPATVMMRDFISGVILKLQNKINEGNYIEIEDMAGIVKYLGHFRLDIVDNQGNIGSIPYHTIPSKIIRKQSDNLNLEKVHLCFTISGNRKVNEIITDLKKKTMNTAWVAVSQEPIVEEVKTENGKTTVKLGVYTLNKYFAENIQEMANQNT